MTLPEAAWRGTACAKVNLTLHVVGRRPDGYHELDSLVAFTDFGDEVALAPAAAPSLAVTGPFAAAVPGGRDNLALGAVLALAAATGRPPDIAVALDKRLPVAAGIGGGSSDAAAVLRGLARLWRIDPDDPVLRRVAAALGADVPVCLAGISMVLGGIGETLHPGPDLAGVAVVLANPGVALATPAVFAAYRASGAGFTPPQPPPAPGVPLDAAALTRHLAAGRNDLEAPAMELVPAIATLRAALAERPGCRLARMTGSGATCFGLFDDAASAASAAAALRAAGWWAEAGRLG